MPIQTVTIPVDVPEGYEAVAFRVPVPGETIQLSDDDIWIVKEIDRCTMKRLIVRKKFDIAVWWPEWLTAEWLVMTKFGEWFATRSECEPHEHDGDWYFGAPRVHLNPTLLAFTPPSINTSDWRLTKLRNPHTKGE